MSAHTTPTIEAVALPKEPHVSNIDLRHGIAIEHGFVERRHEKRVWDPVVIWNNPPGWGIVLTPERAEALAAQLLAAAEQARKDKPDRRWKRQVRYERLYRVVAPVAEPTLVP